MIPPWGTGWTAWLVLCVKYIEGGCDGIVMWLDSHLAVGDSVPDSCPGDPPRPGVLMGWTISCNGNVVASSGDKDGPYSVPHNLPGPVSGHPTLTLWVACGS